MGHMCVLNSCSAAIGASDDDAYSALSGGPAEQDHAAPEQQQQLLLPPALRGPPGRNLSGDKGFCTVDSHLLAATAGGMSGCFLLSWLRSTAEPKMRLTMHHKLLCAGRLRALPAALNMMSPARSWVGRWAANPFARGRGDVASVGGLALYSEAPSAELYLPPPPQAPPEDQEAPDSDVHGGLSPPEGSSLQHGAPRLDHAAGSNEAAYGGWQLGGMPPSSASPGGRSPVSDAAGIEYFSQADRQSLGGNAADAMSPVRQLQSLYRS